MSLPIIYDDETAARKHLEKLQWPDGPICPHCGVINEATLLKGESTRPGVYKCRPCQKPFSVTVGTLFEDSKVPLHKWLYAVHLLTASKKGMSSHQLHRTLGVSYKTAWFMSHRIRESMKPTTATPMGGDGKHIEADETYFGPVEKPATVRTSGQPFTKGRTGVANKRTVVGLVERGGAVRTFHIERATKQSVGDILRTNASRKSRLHTDESQLYLRVGAEFAKHDSVRHTAYEYVRGDVHTNTIEGYFSIFKRGMKGIYQHCSEKHLHRYLSEFDFRYSYRVKLGYSDAMRADQALKGIRGKRLTYRQAN
jgi:transposase-like protein